MYFAVDPCNVRSLCDALHKEVVAHPNKHWMALIDGAFDYGRLPPSWSSEGVPLYAEDGDFRDLHQASPYLLTLDIQGGSFDQSIDRLVKHCRGRPMLSFVATDLPADQLAISWKRCLSVRTDDDQSFLLRFADTRGLPALSRVLSPAGWALLTENLVSWLYVDRAGGLERLQLASENSHGATRITMDSAAMDKLLDLAMPDAIVDVLVKQVPELLPAKGASTIYYQASEVCRFAQHHHVDAMPDIVALMIYRLVTNLDPWLDEVLSKVLTGRDYERGNLISRLDSIIE